MTVQDFPATASRATASRATASRATDLLTDVTTMWAQNMQMVAEQVATPSFPMVKIADTAVAMERWFEFGDRIAKVNRDYALNLAEAVDALGSAVRDHVEGLAEVARDQAQALTDDAKNLSEQAAQAERDLARAARNAERQKVHHAKQAARERYEGLTKAELAEELGKRGLPKTGNVDELVERLVDADAV